MGKQLSSQESLRGEGKVLMIMKSGGDLSKPDVVAGTRHVVVDPVADGSPMMIEFPPRSAALFGENDLCGVATLLALIRCGDYKTSIQGPMPRANMPH